MDVALIVGEAVGAAGRRALEGWRWIRIGVEEAIEGAATLRPALIVVKEIPWPVELVARLRSAVDEAAILVLAERWDREEGQAVIQAGAQCYRAARSLCDQGAIVSAAIRAVRGEDGSGSGSAPSDRSLH